MFSKFFMNLFLLSLSLIVFSCSSQKSGFGDTASGTTTSGSGSGDGTTSGTTDSGVSTETPANYSTTEFFVSMATSVSYTNYVSQFNVASNTRSWGSRCAIASGTATSYDMDCVMDVPELSVNFYGVQLLYNVPPGMCYYVRTIPYWYYNQEVGTGPSAVYLKYSTDADGNVVAASVACSTSSLAAATNAQCNSSSIPDVNFYNDGTSVNIKSVYDYSDVDGYANCAMGTYDLTVQVTDSTAAVTTTVTRGNKWGLSGQGAIKNCLGGQGRTNWSEYSYFGYPIAKIEDSNAGLVNAMVIDPPMTSVWDSDTNISVANYFTYNDTTSDGGTHDHQGFAIGTTTAPLTALDQFSPYYVAPISDRRGNRITSGNPYYIVDCLDQAKEVKQRIKVQIAEWNTMEAFNKYISTGTYLSTNGSPDVSGTAPSSCIGPTNASCNNITDSDDFVTALTYKFYETNPGVVNSSVRANYFPFQYYK